MIDLCLLSISAPEESNSCHHLLLMNYVTLMDMCLDKLLHLKAFYICHCCSVIQHENKENLFNFSFHFVFILLDSYTLCSLITNCKHTSY